MQPRSPRPAGQAIRARTYGDNRAVTTRPIITPATALRLDPKTASRSRRLSISPRLASLVLVVVGIAIIGGLGYQRAASQPALPANISKQLSFGVYFPTANTAVATINKRSINYQASGGLLSYTAQLTDGTTVSVNQQATPESFVDIPQAYDKLVASLQPYTSFDSINGRVSLTYPKELKGSQSAVMNAKGTLLFARPSKSLSDKQWRQLFNGLFAQQIPATK